METSRPTSRSESSVQRTIFFALILSYCGDSALSDSQSFTAESDPFVHIENYLHSFSFPEDSSKLVNSQAGDQIRRPKHPGFVKKKLRTESATRKLGAMRR